MYRGKNFFLVFSILLPVYFVFVTVQDYLRPFKSKVLNILDLSVMINFGILLCTIWYFLMKDYLCIIGVFSTIFVHVLMCTFSLVVFYHIVLVIGQQTRFVSFISVVQYFLKKLTQCLNNSQPVSNHRHYREEFDSSFFDDRYSEYCEPLISP